jgi:signal transduction histidine kinase
VDVHAAPVGGERVVRLNDVTDQVSMRQEQWAFEAMVSHKLRTPLNGVLGTLQFLNEDELTPEERKEFMGLALQSGERLRAAIEGVLAHVESLRSLPSQAGQFHPHEVASLAERLAAELNLPSPAVVVSEDLREQRLGISQATAECILRELLQNAKKFHPRSSPAVEIAVTRPSPHEARFEVRDDGPGMQPSQITRAWTAYYQAEKDFTGEVQGMGLGLSTVASLVWAAGGRCHIHNRPGQYGAPRAGGAGLAVQITLPLAET